MSLFPQFHPINDEDAEDTAHRAQRLLDGTDDETFATAADDRLRGVLAPMLAKALLKYQREARRERFERQCIVAAAAKEQVDLDRGRPLELRRDPGGLRHYLDGQPVHAGQSLEVLMSRGWVACRYEWSFDPDRPPRLYLDMPGAEDAAVLHAPEGTRFRWR